MRLVLSLLFLNNVNKPIKKTVLALVSCIILIINSYAFASGSESLYSVVLPIESHQEPLRDQAIENAFQQVIGRITMTGDAGDQVGTQPDYVELAKLEANQFVTSYSYQEQKASQDKSLYLKVQFDGPSINQALLLNNIPIVGENRPSMFMLLAIHDAQSQESNIMSEHWKEDTMQVFMDVANQYGLNFIFPAMDLTDMQTINYETVWEGDADELRSMVDRYSSKVILLGKANILSNGEWYANWQVSFGEAEYHWSLSTANEQEMAKLLMQNIAGVYKLLFAIQDKNQQVLTLEIVNIADLAEFANLMRYLRKLDMISSVTPESISTEQVKLNISVMGDPQGLIDILNLNNQLVQVDSDVTGEVPMIMYQWREHK